MMSSDEFEFEDMGEFEVIDEVGEDEDSDYSGHKLSDSDLLNDEDIDEEAEAFLKNELVSDVNGKDDKNKLNINDNSLTTEKADTTEGSKISKTARKVADCLNVDVECTVENVKSRTESDSTNEKIIVTRPGKTEIEVSDKKIVKCDQVLGVKSVKNDVKEVDNPNVKNKHEDNDDYDDDDDDDDDYDDDGSEEPGSKKERKETDMNPFIYVEYTKQIEQKMADLNSKFERLEGLMIKSSSQYGPLIKNRKRKNDGILCAVEKFKQCPPDERYLNRCRLYIGIDAETKEPAVGFQTGFGLVKRISEMKHDLPDHLVEAVKVFEKAVKASTLAPGDPSEKTRIWNKVIIDTNSSQDLMILVLLNNPGESSADNLKTLKAELKEFFQNGEGKKCRVISLFTKVMKKFRYEKVTANKEELILRNPYLEETMMGFKLSLTPSPVQFGNNSYVTEIICKGVEELLSPTRKNSVLMLGCIANGVIGFCLSKITREVVFVDSEYCIEDTVKNAERNKITNCYFVSGDHEAAVRKAYRKLRCAEAYAVISSGYKRTLINNMVMNKLRQMETLKKIVLVTELSNSCYNIILTLSNPNIYREMYDPFFPVRAIPIDSMPNTNKYVVLILMERIGPSLSSFSRDMSRSWDRKVPLPHSQYDRNPRDTLPDRYEHQTLQQKYDVRSDMEKVHVDRGRERFFGNDRLREPLTFEDRKLMGDERRLLEVEKRKRHMEEGQRRQYDIEKRRRFEEEDRRHLEDERHRKRPENRQRKRSEERQRKHLEEDRRKRRLEEQQQKRKLEEEQRKKQLEEEQRKKQLEEEQFKKRLEEEWKKKQLEEEQQRKRLEEERQKRLLEEEEQKRQLEEEQKKRRLEEARKKLRLEKERKKRQMEEEEKKKRLEEERKMMLLEKERQRKLEEQQQKKLLEEEEKRKKLEEEQRKRRLEEEEEEQKRQLEEAQRKLQMEEAQKRRQLEEEREQINPRKRDDDVVQNLISHTLKEVGIPEISADTVQKLQHVIAEAIKNAGAVDKQNIDIRHIPEQYFQRAHFDEPGSGNKQRPQYEKKIGPQPLLELKLEKPSELVEGRDFSRRSHQLSNASAAYNYVRYEHLVKSSKQDSANKYARNEWQQPVTSTHDRNASSTGNYGPYWNNKSSDLNKRFESTTYNQGTLLNSTNSSFSSKNSYDKNQLSNTSQGTQLNSANSKYSYKNYDQNQLSNTSQGMQFNPTDSKYNYKDSYNQNQLSKASQETQLNPGNSKYSYNDSYDQNQLSDTSQGAQLNSANSKYSYKNSYDQNQLSNANQGAQLNRTNSKYSYKDLYDQNQLSNTSQEAKLNPVNSIYSYKDSYGQNQFSNISQGTQLNPVNIKYNYKDSYDQNQLPNTSQGAQLNPVNSKYDYKDTCGQNQMLNTSQGAQLNPMNTKYNYKDSYDQNQLSNSSQGAQLNPMNSKYSYKDTYDQNQLSNSSQGAQLNPVSSRYNYKDSYDQNQLPNTSQGTQLNPMNSKYGNKNSYDQNKISNTSQVNPDLRFNYKNDAYNYNPMNSVKQSMTDDRFGYKNPYREKPSSASSQMTSDNRFSYMKDSLSRTTEDSYNKKNPYSIDSASFHSWKEPVPGLSNSQRNSFQGYWNREKDQMGPERK